MLTFTSCALSMTNIIILGHTDSPPELADRHTVCVDAQLVLSCLMQGITSGVLCSSLSCSAAASTCAFSCLFYLLTLLLETPLDDTSYVLSEHSSNMQFTNTQVVSSTTETHRQNCKRGLPALSVWKAQHCRHIMYALCIQLHKLRWDRPAWALSRH